MKAVNFLCVALALAAGFAVGGTALAQDKSDMNASGQAVQGKLVPVNKQTDAAWLASAVAEYPLTTCTVSGDKLGGDMGAPADYIFRQEGKPDRLVRFCCRDCLDDFNKEPGKYLKMIDDAMAAKSKDAAPNAH